MYMQQCADEEMANQHAEFERYSALRTDSELSAALALSLSGFDQFDAESGEDDVVLVTPTAPVLSTVEQDIFSTIHGILGGGPDPVLNTAEQDVFSIIRGVLGGVADPVRQRKPVARKPVARKSVARKPVALKRASKLTNAGVGTTCNICLEDMVIGDKRSVLKCKHVYHHKCLANWMKRSKTCPVDRLPCGKVTVIK